MTPMLFSQSIRAGFDRLAAWSDLLDAINVFPVADGDTGRNLQVSLMPLQVYSEEDDTDRLAVKLLQAARGNSGNIATQFFCEFIKAQTIPMVEAARRGVRGAYRAVQIPREGTMLTLFDALATQLAQHDLFETADTVGALLEALQTTVQNSLELLPRLKAAGVVDAGALGMYLFFEGFFFALIDRRDDCLPPTRRFPEGLHIRTDFQETDNQGYCVDTVLSAGSDVDAAMQDLAAKAESVVHLSRGDVIKLHFHTADRDAARRALEATGALVSWAEDDLSRQVQAFRQRPCQSRVHIATDGAASLTRGDQQRYGFTLLDSYITAGDESLPETRVEPEDLYRRMRAGERITTAQASDFERRQHYQRLLETHSETLYLCVGSAFTGNYEAALTWQARNDPGNRLRIVDTGAASGRLAVMVLAAARMACNGADMEGLTALTERSLTLCREYIFIDRLKYLAAGGRLSRPSAIMGDLFNVKPVVSPLPTGAEKVGSVKNHAEQLEFALQHLKMDLAEAVAPIVLVAYTDNREWVEAKAAEAIAKQFPEVEIILQPLSLTTGTHTGPGTWAVAVHPDPENRTALTAAESSLTSAGRPAPSERNL
jgi:DegV family protein with EDD domain